MVQRDAGKITGSHKGILPVVLPVALLVISTGAVRTYAFLNTSLQSVRSDGTKRTVVNSGLNPTEATFSKYAMILGKLSRPDVDTMSRESELETLAALNTLGDHPISMDGDTFRGASLSPFSPKTLLLSLSQRLAKRAHAAAKRGDFAVARGYVDAMYGLGDHILSSARPSVHGLESAHHFLGFAARVQVSVLSKQGHAGTTARYRSRALTNLWREHISPGLAGLENAPKTSGSRELAARMAREYREGWSRIRAGEA